MIASVLKFFGLVRRSHHEMVLDIADEQERKLYDYSNRLSTAKVMLYDFISELPESSYRKELERKVDDL